MKNTKYFYVVFMVILVMSAVNCANNNEGIGNTPPIPGNSGNIIATNVTGSSITLSWTKALDAETPHNNLLYALYRSGTNNITTVADLKTNGTMIVGGYGVETVPPDTGLNTSTIYYYNVIVLDEGGSEAVYSTLNVSTAGGPYTYTRIDNINNLITDSFALQGNTGTVVANINGQYYVEVSIPTGGKYKVEIDKNVNFTFNAYNNWTLTDSGTFWTFETNIPGLQRIDINTSSSGTYGYVVYRESTDGVTFGPGNPRFVDTY